MAMAGLVTFAPVNARLVGPCGWLCGLGVQVGVHVDP